MTKQASPEWKDEWRLLSPLLDQALALEGEERQTWIKAQEPEIAYRLEILLLEHSVLASDGFLETGSSTYHRRPQRWQGKRLEPSRSFPRSARVAWGVSGWHGATMDVSNARSP